MEGVVEEEIGTAANGREAAGELRIETHHALGECLRIGGVKRRMRGIGDGKRTRDRAGHRDGISRVEPDMAVDAARMVVILIGFPHPAFSRR